MQIESVINFARFCSLDDCKSVCSGRNSCPDDGKASSLCTENDLLFVATLDGIIYALNRADGEIIWEYAVPSGVVPTPEQQHTPVPEEPGDDDDNSDGTS